MAIPHIVLDILIGAAEQSTIEPVGTKTATWHQRVLKKYVRKVWKEIINN